MIENNKKITTYQITRRTMKTYQDVILPVIYEELAEWPGELLEGYFCIGVKAGRTPVGALIAEHEDIDGDLTIKKKSSNISLNNFLSLLYKNKM